jgi:hypothetical protein
MFGALAGYDARDPLTRLALNASLPANYTQFLDAGGLKVLRARPRDPGRQRCRACLFVLSVLHPRAGDERQASGVRRQASGVRRQASGIRPTLP